MRPAERDVVCERALDLLERLFDPDQRDATFRELAPRPRDHARIFASGAAADRARRYYEVLHAVGSSVSPRREHCAIHVFAEQAADLSAQPPGFPDEYARVAHHLAPDVAWLSFAFSDEEGGDLDLHEGLVALEDRFVWLPSPWQALDAVEPALFAGWSD